jgi:hypothetical protein
MENARSDTGSPKSDAPLHVVLDGAAAGLASIKSLGNSKPVRRARAFVGQQANDAPFRTGAIVVGAGLAAGFLVGRARKNRRLFR